MYSLITLVVSILIVLLVLLLIKSKDKRALAIKVLTISFCVIGFFRQYLADSIYLVINGGNFDGVFYEAKDPLQMVIRWGYFSAYSVYVLAAFTKIRLFRNVGGYITLIFVLLSVVYFNDFMVYFVDPKANGLLLGYELRAIYFVLELSLAIAIPVLIHINEKHVFNFKSVKEWRNLILGSIGIGILTMPPYIPQSIFGYVGYEPDSFSLYHIIWIAIILAMTLMLYFLFRFRNYEERYALCLYLAVVLFFHYNSIFTLGVTLGRLPFQLCNVATYFFLIAIIFKLEKFFHFIFIANIVGTIIAIVAPDFNIGYASYRNMHYIYEHTLVLVIPALLAGLRIFKRINIKSLKPLLIGYTSYFLFCFIVGTILNGYSDVTHETVNYFFMFDQEMAFDYFPFITFAGEYSFQIGRFVVYPILISLVYFGFFALCLLFYLFVQFCYKLDDDHLVLRLSSIMLYEKITGKKSRRPKNFID